VDDGGRPEEEDVVDLAVDVDANLELRGVVGDDLALLRHLLADQDGSDVRLDELRLTHVAHPELGRRQGWIRYFSHMHRSHIHVRLTDGSARIFFLSLNLSRNKSPYG